MTALLLVPVLAAAVLAPGTAWAQESTPSPSPSPTVNCPYVEFSADRYVIQSGEVVTITARRVLGEPGQRVSATLKRRTPEPAATVRSDTSTATVVMWPLRLGETHDFLWEYPATGQNCRPLGRPNGGPLTIEVAPVVTINATRNGPRDYTFTGRVLPAKAQTVTLYRHTATGSRVLTAQGTVRPDGTYRIDRRFAGSGRIGVSAAVKESSAHLAGSSAVRPTVIH